MVKVGCKKSYKVNQELKRDMNKSFNIKRELIVLVLNAIDPMSITNEGIGFRRRESVVVGLHIK